MEKWCCQNNRVGAIERRSFVESHPSPQSCQAKHPVPLKGCGHLPTTQAIVECQNLEKAVILERIPREVIKQLLLAGSTSSAVSSSHRTEWEFVTDIPEYRLSLSPPNPELLIIFSLHLLPISRFNL